MMGVTNAEVGAVWLCTQSQKKAPARGRGYRHGWLVDVGTGGSRSHHMQANVIADLTN
jgi:hypothetical protein